MWQGKSASAEDVDRAVTSVRRAFAAWSAIIFDERVAVAKRFAALLNENKEALASAIGRETGKPLWKAHPEVASMAAKVDISVQAYHDAPAKSARRSPMASRCCGIVRMAWWRCSGRTTFRGICRTGISCRR